MKKSGLRNHSFAKTEMIPLFLLLVCGLSSAAETGKTQYFGKYRGLSYQFRRLSGSGHGVANDKAIIGYLFEESSS